MNKITESASKLVLLYVMGILGILALVAGVYSVITQTLGEGAKMILLAFTGAITFLLGFYFGYKGDSSQTGKSSSIMTELTTSEKGLDIPSQFTK